MKLSEEEIRKLTLEAINKLGSEATPDKVKLVVEKSIEGLSGITESEKEVSEDSGRVILTSFGVNHHGIIAKITDIVSGAKCDIRDLSQKIMDEFYTMIMIIDISNSPKDFNQIQSELKAVAEEMKIKIYLQHEDVFRYMHRI